MDLSKLTTGDKIVLGTMIVLFLDLLLFPWHSIDLGPFGSVDRAATESPNGFWGLLALLLAIVIIAVVIIRKLTTVELPDLPISWGQAQFFAGIAVLAILLLKLVLETEALGFGAYLAILLAAGGVYGGYVTQQETESA